MVAIQASYPSKLLKAVPHQGDLIVHNVSAVIEVLQPPTLPHSTPPHPTPPHPTPPHPTPPHPTPPHPTPPHPTPPYPTLPHPTPPQWWQSRLANAQQGDLLMHNVSAEIEVPDQLYTGCNTDIKQARY